MKWDGMEMSKLAGQNGGRYHLFKNEKNASEDVCNRNKSLHRYYHLVISNIFKPN